MKKIFYLFAATVVLAAVGCSKDDAAQEEVKYVSEIKIGFEGDTRVTAEQIASGLKFSFKDGEEICLNEYNPNRFGINIYYVYDASSKTFKAKNETYKLQAGKKYFAMAGNYLSISVDLDDAGNIIAHPSLNTNTGLSNIPMITDVFTASADGTIATMHHLVGVVEVPVKLSEDSTNDILGKIRLSGSEGINLSGDMIATPAAPYLKEVKGGGYLTTSGNLDIKLSKDAAISVFIPVLPGTYTDAITLNWYRSGDDTAHGGILGGTYSEPKTLVVERGKITKVTERTISLD
ncbi:MAG: hypothetical protein IJB63_04685 [Alistipes sp.]|nr:hypothetical protein [Alistipes sp.]